MNTSEYMERLRAIRQKYGCSTTLAMSEIPPSTTSQMVCSNARMHSDSYHALDKKKIIQNSASTWPTQKYGRNYGGYEDPSIKYERDWEYRENYAGSRRKQFQGLVSRQEQTGLDFSINQRNDESKYNHESSYGCIRRSSNRSVHNSFIGNEIQAVSPVRRVAGMSSRKEERYEDVPDSTYREREARLREITSNRMKEAESMAIQSKYLRPASSSGYQKSGYRRTDTQNMRPASISSKGYSVSSIDRIQERIRAVLGRK